MELSRADRPRSTPQRRLALAICGVLAVAGASVSSPPSTAVAQIVLAKDIVVPTEGRLGPLTVLGDSVMLGSGITTPTLPDRLSVAGWGPVRYRATVGMRAGSPNDQNAAGWWLGAWRATGWDAPTVLVNLGANDVGTCQTSIACARTRITAVLDLIGPGRRVWWPLITHPRADYAAAWNAALTQVDAERLDVVTWDWPAEMAAGGYSTSDGVHLSGPGYVRRSARIAERITADLGSATRVGGGAAVPAATAAATRFVAVAPTRVIDTRLEPPGRQQDGQQLAVSLAGRVPAGSIAAAVNITAASPNVDGYLAAGACGTSYGGSVVNFTAGVARGAMTVVPLSADGRLCVSTRGSTDVIVDVQGAFVEGGGGQGFSPLAADRRVLDTRRTGRATRLVVPTPPGAAAVALNLTVDAPADGGWLRAAPCDAPSGVSNVNFLPGETIAGAAFVATSDDDTVCIDVTTAADVIVDLTGTFGEGGLSFVPVRPTRMLDTRTAIGGWSPVHGPDQVLDVTVAPTSAEAVTGTMTLVQPATGGYLVGHRCGLVPPTSSVNARAGQVLANSLTTGISSGRLCVTSSVLTHTLFDVTGWWVR